MTALLDAGSLESPASPSWYDDACSCLQMATGAVFAAHGWDPVQALASSWRFVAPSAPVEPVEFYHPAGDALGEQFCLHHPLRLTWRRPASAEHAQDDLREALATGRHPLVAVNNFHLPFRPAYHDVHAAHLVLVTELDTARDEVHLHDPMPPAFRGAIPADTLARARDNLVVEDDSDPFFAGVRPGWRWLEIAVEGPQPTLSWPWLHAVLRGNVDALRRADTGPRALEDILRRLPAASGDWAERPDRLLWRDVYVLGWPAQAEASLHARFLATAAQKLDRPDLAGLARSVDSVAHAWTGLRVSAAHAGNNPDAANERIIAHAHRLLSGWDECLRRYQRLVDDPQIGATS